KLNVSNIDSGCITDESKPSLSEKSSQDVVADEELDDETFECVDNDEDDE
ncbi:MAG: hypothetical protein Harvfovirus23_1, partial [Harvfovirus sp.]